MAEMKSLASSIRELAGAIEAVQLLKKEVDHINQKIAAMEEEISDRIEVGTYVVGDIIAEVKFRSVSDVKSITITKAQVVK